MATRPEPMKETFWVRASRAVHDAVRERRTLWCALESSCHPLEVPVPEAAPDRGGHA